MKRSNTGSTVWADTAYRSKKNEAWLDRNGYASDIHHEKPKDSQRARRQRGPMASAEKSDPALSTPSLTNKPG